MNELAVTVAIVLFPGLIAVAIADKITVHSPRWGSFKYGVYSFIFGVFCYIALSAAAWVISRCPSLATHFPISTGGLRIWSFVSERKGLIEPAEVLAATAFAPVIAYAAAFAVNYKIFNKVAAKLGVSRKYGDENLFSFFLNSDDIDWVYVRDRDSRLTYEGRVFSYSENTHMQELVLANVKVYSYEDSEELYFVPSIYLSKPNGSFIIESIPGDYLEGGNGKEAAE